MFVLKEGYRNIRDVEGRTLPNQKPPTTKKSPMKSKKFINRVVSGLLTGTDEEEMEMELPVKLVLVVVVVIQLRLVLQMVRIR